MADARLRDLERRWRASGGVDDETALLRARLHARTLARERLALAASWGHGPAAEALGVPVPPGERLDSIARRTVLAGGVDVALECARGLFVAVLERPGPGLDARGRGALEALLAQADPSRWDFHGVLGLSVVGACFDAARAVALADREPAALHRRFADAIWHAARASQDEDHLRKRMAARVVPWLLGTPAAPPT